MQAQTKQGPSTTGTVKRLVVQCMVLNCKQCGIMITNCILYNIYMQTTINQNHVPVHD